MIPFTWVEGAWYPTDWVLQVINNRNCPEDSERDPVWPTNNDLNTAPTWWYSIPVGDSGPYFQDANPTLSYQARVLGWVLWNLICQWWDSRTPTATNLSYTDGWTNNTTISITVNGSDTGGSGIKQYEIEYQTATDSPNFTTWTPWSSWDTKVTTAGSTTSSKTIWNTSWSAYRFRFRIIDGAWLPSNWVAWTQIYKLDTTPPNPDNLITGNELNLLANTNQVFNMSFNDVGAPIKVDYRFENNGNPAVYDTLSTPSYSYNYNYIRDVSKVDFDRADVYALGDPYNRDISQFDLGRESNGWRQLSIQIDKICDQAWNCIWTVGWPSLKTITHFIYANPWFSGINSQDSTAITNGDAVADGQARNFIQTIKDGYGNAIVPASGINRTVSMNLSGINNTMYLNQYNRSNDGWTSVFVDDTKIALPWNGSQSLGNRSSSDGSYSLPIRVYTPTKWTSTPESDPNASFWFTQNLIVNDDLIWRSANKTFSQYLSNPVFKPLYTTSIGWDIRNGGFIEGAIQSSNIAITSNSTISTANTQLQVEFSWSNSPYFDFFGWSINPPTNQIWSRSVMINNPLWVGLNTIALYTNLIQKIDTTVDSISKIQLSTHIAYTLDGKNIVYNSDIIGKDSFWGNTVSWLGNQVGIKILGPIASNTIKALTTGQFDANTSIFSGINRGTIRNNIRKTVSILTRNIVLLQAGKNISSVTNLPTGTEIKWNVIDGQAGSILYMEWNGETETVTLTNKAISGKRTIILKWLNLYITADMYYANNTSILGIILLKDDNGNGWNLYINPSITNMVWSYIIDGSAISYDGVNEISVWDIATLKNQLYIYGSIVSENTIGGSRISTAGWQVKCPSLLNIENCTTALAQKYDLNYLRRYYLYNNLPFWNGVVAWQWRLISENLQFPTSGDDANLIKKISSYTDELAKYPIIIEYLNHHESLSRDFCYMIIGIFT